MLSKASSCTKKFKTILYRFVLVGSALLVVAVLAWQGITASGAPDPTLPHKSIGAAVLDIGVLVFREGLECILVLSAIVAGMKGKQQHCRHPIAVGAGVGLLATLITWFVAVGIISDLTHSLPALDVQAATGLLAVIVLLIVMNWFFHNIYWTSWISMHNRKKRDLLQSAETTPATRLVWGLGLLGFASVFREGVEVVLFLQSYRLRLGGAIVLQGVLLGLLFTSIVAILNFVAHQRLPYKKMLVVTGVMLGFVLLVMVGEQAQEMQLAHWIPATNIAFLRWIPNWMGVWFSIFPTVETLIAQGLAFVLVLGSYLLSKCRSAWSARRY